MSFLYAEDTQLDDAPLCSAISNNSPAKPSVKSQILFTTAPPLFSQEHETVFIVSADGLSEPASIFDMGTGFRDPIAWSSDGTKFAATGGTATDLGVFVVNSGGATQQLAHFGKEEGYVLPEILNIQWLNDNDILFDLSADHAPNGQHVNRGLYVLDTSTRDVKRITDEEMHINDFILSPDNKSIAFTASVNDSSQFDIYLMDADGSNVRLLDDSRVQKSVVAWSQDGGSINVVHFEPYKSTFYQVDIMSKEQKFIEDNIGSPFFSTNGKYIVFASQDKIYRINSDWTSPCVLADFTTQIDNAREQNEGNSFDVYSTVQLDWSPDSQQIAYFFDIQTYQHHEGFFDVLPASLYSELGIVNFDGTNPISLVRNEPIVYIAWQPVYHPFSARD